MTHFEGLMAAPFTPFDHKGNLHLDIVPDYVEKLVNDGVKGVFVCGSNGEGPNMTSEERILTARSFIQAAAGRLKIFVHVGHASIRESQELAVHAQANGADAISCVSAFYFKPATVSGLVDALAEIASATPNLPFYYYHIPGLTGVDMDMTELLALGKQKIPNLAGIKYTASTLWKYQLCKAFDDGRYDILFGTDEMMLPALAVGARGLIGSTYNFAAPLYLQVMDSFDRMDIETARKKMTYLIEMVNIIIKYPPIAAQKAVMKRLGLDLGPSRLPLVSFSPAQETEFLKQLDEISFFEELLAVSSTLT